MVGRYSREKRQDVLIAAVRKSRYADRIQLVLAGKGPTRGHYARLGKKLKNKPIMQFYSQAELIKIMNSSDLYVHPSDAEIEGISAMEAMACGLVPVISDSKLSATHQYALCPESLFKAGDAASLAEKIDY
jgi:glycosyltransferase involved in cell wall biosynthesis